MKDRDSLLITTPHFGRMTGGLGVSAERITRNLLLHYDIVVLTVSRELPPLEISTEIEPGLTVVRIGSGERPRLLQAFSDQTASLIRTHHCRTAVAFYISELAYAASLGARAAGIAWGVLGRGDDVDLEPFQERGWMTLETVRHASLVGAVSREMAAKLSAYGAADRVRYVPNGVDPAIFAPHTRHPIDDGMRVGLFGVIKPKKGLTLLLEMLAAESFDPVEVGNGAAFPCTLVISGVLRDEAARELHGMATLRPELRQRVTLLPYSRDERELVERYHAVDVVVIPSSHEGMSNVMLESMACGRVCVCSAVGGALDVIRDGENGFLFSPGDRDGLRTALGRALAASRAPERTIGAAARAHVASRFTFREERAAYHRFVEELGALKPR